MWSLYHKALIVNIWKAKFLKEVKVGCKVCDHAEQDILAHRFYYYPKLNLAWTYGVSNEKQTKGETYFPHKKMMYNKYCGTQ